MSDTKSQIQEVQKTLMEDNPPPPKTAPRHIIFKLWEIKDKNLERSQIPMEEQNKNYIQFLFRNCQQGGREGAYIGSVGWVQFIYLFFIFWGGGSNLITQRQQGQSEVMCWKQRIQDAALLASLMERGHEPRNAGSSI